MDDKIIGERIVATYQDFTPKSGYGEAEDGSGRKEMTLKKSVRCKVEKAIKKRG
ncbi:MAG: hypothetical protein U9O85_00975 [Euryarchaeota archaeon]|nr:hypothetical protein [Euryarchaeota archaeon]